MFYFFVLKYIYVSIFLISFFFLKKVVWFINWFDWSYVTFESKRKNTSNWIIITSLASIRWKLKITIKINSIYFFYSVKSICFDFWVEFWFFSTLKRKSDEKKSYKIFFVILKIEIYFWLFLKLKSCSKISTTFTFSNANK